MLILVLVDVHIFTEMLFLALKNVQIVKIILCQIPIHAIANAPIP